MSCQEDEPIDRDTITPASIWIHDLLSPQLLNVQNVDSTTLYELLTIFKISREKWMSNTKLSTETLYDILSLHLKNTYRKLKEQRGLFKANDCMIFNTGLRDKFGNLIYAYYTPYRIKRTNLASKSATPKWGYEGLGTREGSSNVCKKIRKRLKHHLNEASWSPNLLFDGKLARDTLCKYTDDIHCMIDNALRIPLSLIDEAISEVNLRKSTHKFLSELRKLDDCIEYEYSHGQTIELYEHINRLKEIVENFCMSWWEFLGNYKKDRKIKDDLELTSNPRGLIHSLIQYAIRRYIRNNFDEPDSRDSDWAKKNKVVQKLRTDLKRAIRLSIEEIDSGHVAAHLGFYPSSHDFSWFLPIKLNGVEYAMVVVEEPDKSNSGKMVYKGKTLYTKDMCYEYIILRKLFLKDS